MDRTLQLTSEYRISKLETRHGTYQRGGMENWGKMVDRAAERAYELLHTGQRRA
jgi:hypothetical protein